MQYTNARPDREIEKAIAAAKNRATQLWENLTWQDEYPDSGYGITPISPLHVDCGGANWGSCMYWASSFSASSVWDAWIDLIQTDAAFLVITGLWNYEAAPKACEIYFEMDGKQLPTINIEEIYSYEVARLFLAKPFVIQPEKGWKYYHRGSAAGSEREGLLGYTIGKRSYLILREGA